VFGLYFVSVRERIYQLMCMYVVCVCVCVCLHKCLHLHRAHGQVLYVCVYSVCVNSRGVAHTYSSRGAVCVSPCGSNRLPVSEWLPKPLHRVSRSEERHNPLCALGLSQGRAMCEPSP
jgi:hypothetical protein